MRKTVPCPSIDDVTAARQEFIRREPRDLFYKVASELIALSLGNATAISLTESLAVLLLTWNRQFYRFRRFDEQHFISLEGVLNSNAKSISFYRGRSILSLVTDERSRVVLLFSRFHRVLGRVGAAKCLHLLAPRFFPLWDDRIAKAYGFHGRSADEYAQFMKIVQDQCRSLHENSARWGDMLKALDEYNYCRYTLGASSEPSIRQDRAIPPSAEKEIGSMDDGEITKALAAIGATEAVKAESGREHARRRAREQRDLLKELRRHMESGELFMDKETRSIRSRE